MSADSPIPKPATNARSRRRPHRRTRRAQAARKAGCRRCDRGSACRGRRRCATHRVRARDEDETAQAFSAEEREMLLRLLRFGASRVEDIMVPRADIIALDETEPIRELLRTFKEAGVSPHPALPRNARRSARHDPHQGSVPLADGGSAGPRAGAAVGSQAAAPSAVAIESAMPTIADLDLGRCDLGRPITAAKIRRQVLYVPPSMPADEPADPHAVDAHSHGAGRRRIRRHRWPRHDRGSGRADRRRHRGRARRSRGRSTSSRDPKLGLVASARTPIEELEEHLGIEAARRRKTEEDIDTLGGLVFAIVGRVPARGELDPPSRPASNSRCSMPIRAA